MHSKEGAEFGFLGVRSIAEAMVTGLSSVSTGPRMSGSVQAVEVSRDVHGL